MNGFDVAIIVILALLAPVLFQVVMLANHQRKDHKELMEELRNIKELLQK